MRSVGMIVALAALVARGAEVSPVETERAESFAEAVTSARLERWTQDAERLRAAYALCLSRLDELASGIVVPVECFPDGALKIAATAEKAQFFETEGLVWCGGVTVRELLPDGSVKFAFTAEGCLVDRRTKSGWFEGIAHGVYGKTELTGDGIYFSFPDEFVKISSKVVIDTTEFKFQGVKL